MGLDDGDNAVVDNYFTYREYNLLKNHWRAATAPSGIQDGMIWSDSDDDKLYHHASSDEEILQLTRSNDVSPQFATVRLMDTGADHYLELKCNEDLTGHKLLNLVVGDTARTLTLAGNPTLHTFTSADWLDQAVKIASSPTFAGITVAGFLNIDSASATLSSNAITATKSWMKLTAEGAAHDQLDTISGGSEGDIVILSNEGPTYNVVVKDGADNINIDGDFTLTGSHTRSITLMLIGSTWREIARSYRA